MLHLTSVTLNSSSKTTLTSGVAPKITFSELITRPHDSTTVLCLFNFVSLS